VDLRAFQPLGADGLAITVRLCEIAFGGAFPEALMMSTRPSLIAAPGASTASPNAASTPFGASGRIP